MLLYVIASVDKEPRENGLIGTITALSTRESTAVLVSSENLGTII